jgi:hypothetical protein
MEYVYVFRGSEVRGRISIRNKIKILVTESSVNCHLLEEAKTL